MYSPPSARFPRKFVWYYPLIRGNYGSNYNATSGQFVAGLKTAIQSNLAYLGSGNCKVDDCSSMSDYKEFLTTTAHAQNQKVLSRKCF